MKWGFLGLDTDSDSVVLRFFLDLPLGIFGGEKEEIEQMTMEK